MDDSNKNKLIKLENLNKFKELIIEKIISPIVTNITNLQKSLENKAEKTHNHTIKDVTNLQTTLDGKAPEKYNLQFEGAISSNFREKITGTKDECGFVKSFRKNDTTDACMPQYSSGIAWGQADTHGMLCVNYNNQTAYVAGGNQNKLNWYKQLAWKDDITNLQTTLDSKASSTHNHDFNSLSNLPTTLSGYGITNVYTKTEINNKINSKTNVQSGEIITTNNDTIGYFKNIKINGNTRYKKSDKTYTDTWESGVSLESVGEAEKNSDGKYPIGVFSCGSRNLCLKDKINWTDNHGGGSLNALTPFLEEGKVYTIYGNNDNSSYNLYINILNYNWGTKIADGSVPFTFTYSKDMKVIQFLNDTVWTPTSVSQLQIKEGENNNPTFEEYKGDKRTVLLDSPLRKVGEVSDILDLDNSQITRKCKTITIDGSSDENWVIETLQTPFILFYCKITENAPKNYDIHLISDKFSSFRYDTMWGNTNEGISVSNNILRINISKSKLETQDVAGFKKWLQSNPVTVVYQLATPITEDIEVSSNTLTDFATSCTLTIGNTIKGNIECNEVVGLIPSVEENGTRLTNLETDNTTNKSNITNLQKSLENKAEKNHTHTIADVTNLQTTLDSKVPKVYENQVLYGTLSSNFRTWLIGSNKVGGFAKPFRKDDDKDSSMPQFGAGIAWGQADTNGMLCVDYSNPTAYVAGGNGNKLNWYKQIAWKDDLTTTLFERNNGTINKNINTCFDSSSGTFTAPEAGQYLVMCSGYKLSNSNMYIACVVGGENSNRNELYTTGSSGFTLITLSAKQTLMLYECPTGNISNTCISSNSAVNMLIARIK